MAAIITIQDVKDFAPTSVPDSVINRYIALLATADQCLDEKGVPQPSQELVKLYAIAHMLTMQQGGGVKSETDMDGASVTFAGMSQSGETSYLEQLKSLDGYGCVKAIVNNSRQKRFSASVGC